MGLNDTPSGERTHIGFFGRRNAGKSSLVNKVTNQDLSVVSKKKGTTTDPVKKAMELLPLGPVVIIDTPGFDDSGELGELRVKKTQQTLNKTDIAVLVADAVEGLKACDHQLLQLFREKEVSYITVFNKSDLVPNHPEAGENEVYVSALTGDGVNELKEKMGHLVPQNSRQLLVADLLQPKDVVLLVTPIDESAPKGRMILPQQMMMRDVLDAEGICIVAKETELKEALACLQSKPAMVITDSQVFAQAAEDTPDDIPLTSFSILMARYKGFLKEAVEGVTAIDRLKDGDTVLIAEGCTHHRQCGDIGSVKLPNWLKKRTGKALNIELSSGAGFPEDLSRYAMILQCGGCMLNAREVRYRMKCALDQGVPMTNYGTAIAYMTGILERSIAVLPDVLEVYRRGKVK